MTEEAASPRSFVLETEPGALEDLRSRLRATRWPDAPVDAGWSLGTDLGYLCELVDYWIEEFDWPAQQAALNAFPHFQIELGHTNIHFVHARAPGERSALPLILCHSWPDSFWRYAKVIPLLTDPAAHGGDPADAFDVVVPDMPGYGYSGHPSGPARDGIEVGVVGRADDGRRLPTIRAAGGDLGSGISRYLALDHPDRVRAVHRMDGGLPVYPGDPALLTPEQRTMLETSAAWGRSEGAHAVMHRTKPQTAAVGLTDSPAALAAWIVEKLRPGATAAAMWNPVSPRTRSSPTSPSTG